MPSSDHILDLIPQRPPFIFVDKLTDITENSFKSQYLVRKENPLCDGNILCEAGIIEHIAQSMAAHIGYSSKDEIKIGVLGSVNHFTVWQLPMVSQLLETDIQIISRIFGITLLKAEVKSNGVSIATAEMKVVIPESY